MPSLQMIYDVVAVDSASAKFKAMGASADATSVSFAKLGKAAEAVGKWSAVAVAAFAAYSVKSAADFQKNTNLYVTAAGESQRYLKTVQDGVLKVAQNTGTAVESVASAGYIVEKAGYRAGDVYKVLEAGAQGAKEENANLTTVVTGLTSVMASYHLKASDAVAVTDELKTAAGESKTTFEDYVGSLSTVLPLASSLKVSFADVGGALATLTQHGTTANEGTQELSSTLRNLAVPLGPAVAEMNKLGLSSVDVANKLGDGPGGRGLTGTLQYLYTTVQKSLGPSGDVILKTFNNSKLALSDASTEFNALSPAVQGLAKQFEAGSISSYQYTKDLRSIGGEQGVLGKQFLTSYSAAHGFQQELKTAGSPIQTADAALRKLTGGAIGLNTILQLAGPNFDATVARSKKISEAFTTAGKNVNGWASTQKLFSTQLDEFGQTVQVAAIKLGEKLLPALKDIVSTLAQHPGLLEAAAAAVGLFAAAWVAVKVNNIITGIGQIGSAIGTLIGKLFGLTAATNIAAGAEETFAAKSAAAQLILDGEGGLGASADRTAGKLAGVGGAATETGAAFASSGLLLGGAAILGIGGLALATDQLVNAWGHIPKDLPNLDALALSIGKTGKTSAATTNLVANSLSKASSGNNRGESQGQAFERIAGDIDPASKTGATLGADYGLSLKTLFSTIETGTRGSLAGFLSGLDSAERATGANNDTVQKANEYYTGLFNRFNSGRAASASVTKAANERTAAALAESTNVKKLSAAYGISALSALALAAENKKFESNLIAGNSALSLTNSLVLDNSKAGKENKQIIGEMALGVQAHAAAVLKDTGSQTASNAAFKDGIKQIEANAEKLGFNKQQVDALLTSLGLIPPQKSTTVTTPGLDAANQAVLAFLGYVNSLPVSKQVTIDVAIAGANLGKIGANLGAGLFSANGNIFEQHNAQISKGMRIWAEPETGGEAYIPLAASKRSRSLSIWAKTGSMLGVQGFADGGIAGIVANSPAAHYLTALSDVAKYLKSLAAAQAALVTKLGTFVSNEQQYRDSLQGQISSGNTFSDVLSQSGTLGDVKSLLSSKLGDLKTFVSKITALKKAGWPDAIIRELASDGVAQGTQYATLLLTATGKTKSSLIAGASALGANQLAGANATTLLTGGTAGLTSLAAIQSLTNATFSPGANAGYWTQKAAQQQGPAMVVQNQIINTPVDLQLIAKQALFQQRAGGFT